ncbi:MAG TPA: amidohydrolase family protein [Candidatus Deferrimicrobiaceae bacterium]|nr:amidohydrolase family protein [Candidatus Deferrimicrobiaceae bacterium]
MRPIIDVHVHLYPAARLGSLMRWVHRAMPEHPVPVDITVPQAVADLRAAGVQRFFSAVFPLAPGEARGLNRFNASLVRDFPEMIPLGTVHQDDPDPGAVANEALGDLGLKGIKLHPMMMKMAPADPRLAAVYALAEEAGVPLLVHTGFEEGYGRTADKEGWERLFCSYPRLTFLLAHAFFPDLPYAFALLTRFENVFLDLTNVPGMFLWKEDPLPFGISRPAWGKEEFLAAIEEHSGRLLFGSDHPAGMGTIGEIVAQFETFGLSEDAVGKILHGNARGLLRRLEME